MAPGDPFVLQQLALATYKSKQPDPKAALLAAHKILQPLSPASTNDPETLGLWGAIHKRLWELGEGRAMLDESIGAYERGFLLKQDYYNGINLAFLLDVRALEEKTGGQADECTADRVRAQRIRRDVIGIAESHLEVPDQKPEARFWLLASAWEAAVGLRDARAPAWDAELDAMPVPDWMQGTRRSQVPKLVDLHAKLYA